MFPLTTNCSIHNALILEKAALSMLWQRSATPSGISSHQTGKQLQLSKTGKNIPITANHIKIQKAGSLPPLHYILSL